MWNEKISKQQKKNWIVNKIKYKFDISGFMVGYQFCRHYLELINEIKKKKLFLFLGEKRYEKKTIYVWKLMGIKCRLLHCRFSN